MTELTRKKLGMAVAREVMGWTEIDYRDFFVFDYDGPLPAFYLREASRDWLTICESKNSTRSWKPWRDMNNAWEVDREEWLWTMDEHQMGVDAKLTVLNPSGVYWATVEWDEALSRPGAWCTARLRAALKAVRGSG